MSCLFRIISAAALRHINLSTHSGKCNNPLRQPDKHAADSDSCDRFGAEHTDPCHIGDAVGSSEKGRSHNWQSQFGQCFKNRTASQVQRFCFTHNHHTPNMKLMP